LKIISGKRARPRRTMLYGKHGIGKSTWAAGAPAPFFLQCEEGLDDVGVDRSELLTSLPAVMDTLQCLHNEPHNFETVVVDTLDWYGKLAEKVICEREGVPSIDKISYHRGYGYCVPIWQNFLAWLDSLKAKRGMNVVLLAHSKIVRFQDPKTDGYDRYEPALHAKTVCPLVQEWCDEVFFADTDVAVITSEAGFGQERTRAIDSNVRTIFTCEMPTHLAKRRIPMPDQIGMSWAEYQQHIDAAYGTVGDIAGIVTDGSPKPKE